MSKTFLAALAASTLLAGAAFAADATSTSTPAATPAKTHTAAKTATAPVTPLVPFTGKASSFKAGADDKTATVSDKAGDWFTLSFASSCKGLDGAKSVTLSKAGWAKFSAKSKCKVSGFEKAVASNDTAPAMTPAPAATTAPATTTPAPTTH